MVGVGSKSTEPKGLSLTGLWTIHVHGIFCEKRREKERKREEKERKKEEEKEEGRASAKDCACGGGNKLLNAWGLLITVSSTNF